MSAHARLPPAPDPFAYLRSEPTPREICPGSAVRVSPFGGRTKDQMTEEGVVIDVVKAGEPVRTPEILYARRLIGSRSTVTRYVIQCANYRVVRRGSELVVIAL